MANLATRPEVQHHPRPIRKSRSRLLTSTWTGGVDSLWLGGECAPVIKRLPVLVAGLGIATAVGIATATVTTAGSTAAALSPGVVRALADQNVTLRTPPASANPPVSAAAAVNSNTVQSSSDIVSEELVELTGPMTQAKPVLAWAIQEKISQQVYSAAGNIAGGPPLTAVGTYNYRVDFVNASTGKLIFATEGSA